MNGECGALARRYTKRPVDVYATLWDGSDLVRQFLFEWSNGHVRTHPDDASLLRCATLEGDINVCVGAYVVRGVEGEFYPCKAAIFEKTYSPFDEAKS